MAPGSSENRFRAPPGDRAQPDVGRGPAPAAGGGVGRAAPEPGGEGSTARPTVTVQPTAGCGVVFNGTVQHAGRAVARGLRHVLGASVSITNAEYVSETAKKSRRYWISNGG